MFSTKLLHLYNITSQSIELSAHNGPADYVAELIRPFYDIAKWSGICYER